MFWHDMVTDEFYIRLDGANGRWSYTRFGTWSHDSGTCLDVLAGIWQEGSMDPVIPLPALRGPRLDAGPSTGVATGPTAAACNKK